MLDFQADRSAFDQRTNPFVVFEPATGIDIRMHMFKRDRLQHSLPVQDLHRAADRGWFT